MLRRRLVNGRSTSSPDEVKVTWQAYQVAD
jgi:hypothetical protein